MVAADKFDAFKTRVNAELQPLESDTVMTLLPSLRYHHNFV